MSEELGEGVIIITGRNSFVTLRLSDGSILALPSQSTMKILRLRRIFLTGAIERDFKLLQGRTKARVMPMPDDGSTFRVQTPVSHAAVRGTLFRSAYDRATGVALTEVDEGSVLVTATNKPLRKLVLQSNLGSAVGSSMGFDPVHLLGPPELRNAGAVQTEEKLHFSLSPVQNAERYRVEIARDAALLDPIAEEISNDLDFTFDSQPAGIYFAKVAALDKLGLEGASRTYSFERRRNGVNGALQQRGQRRKRYYLFKWEAIADGEPVFRFTLHRIGDATPMVDELGLKDQMLSITDLPPGSYAWQVLSTLFIEGRAIEARMPEQTFEVAKRK